LCDIKGLPDLSNFGSGREFHIEVIKIFI